MSIDKYLEQVDLVDYYITKNIVNLVKNDNELENIMDNIFILSYNNKINKNSLNILLENKEYKIIEKLIKYNNLILDYKNKNEQNLFMNLVEIEYFHDLIINMFNTLEIDFLIKIITENDVYKVNFIDTIIYLIIANEEYILTKYNIHNFNKLIEIIKMIYLLGKEDKTFLLTKLCNKIIDKNVLKYIINYIDPKNIDIYPDENLFTCIDYLILNNNLEILNIIVNKVTYIYFINIDYNSLLKLIEEFKDIKDSLPVIIKLVFDILKKSNIAKIKNNRNQNIFYYLLNIGNKIIDYRILLKHINLINIYEQDIDGNSIYNIIKKIYTKKEVNEILSKYEKKEYKLNINLKNYLIYTETGLFNADVLHNIIYTIIFLKKYKNLRIPNIAWMNINNKKNNELMELSNNDMYINSLLKVYFYNFNTILPHLIMWKNKTNYIIDVNLINWLLDPKLNNKRYVYIKLSINLLNKENSRHANLLLIDNKNKIVERFEPYGEIYYYNSLELNTTIINEIAKPLGYQFIFSQPYPGFQTRSDEFNDYNKVNGDPFGYCLAWCFLYLEINMYKEKLNLEKEVSTIDIINNYIINKFKGDFKMSENIYMCFIRYYGKNLDNEKNKLLKKLKINKQLLYQNNIDNIKYKEIINKLNKELINIIKK